MTPNSGKVTPLIVIIRAAGYAGATWVNTVLGSHPEALAMGPPNRVWRLGPADADTACFLHRENCDFWPGFLRNRDPNANFFQQLADYSDKRVFVLNYPEPDLLQEHIETSGFEVRHIKLLRDGRANLYSYMRHHRASAIEGILYWQIGKLDEIDRSMPADPSKWMMLRYEDLVFESDKSLRSVGDLVGLHYPDNAIRFWEHEHHPTAGNTGVIDMLCRLKGMPTYSHVRADFYAAAADRAHTQPHVPFYDEGWKDRFSRKDRLAFDVLLGERNAAAGYDRDYFDVAEVERFQKNLPRLRTTAERQYLAKQTKKQTGVQTPRMRLRTELLARLQQMPAFERLVQRRRG